ncbi:BTB/POZ and MATH domain-containing protein 3 [Dichanthelium oligosanthes]|uniref:BTB/POZ and MATH domain-containing protein 3 n=1 Tax=Dichanthelium oligosanthes TaxID=888268 RepID=A0A1E5UZ17_9POAL|nr:BTB/POZ and MATH domain-containing protein 3 [Dichanthelium oligosanthes]
MADATMPSITLHDIAPETFKIMLRFIYEDALPADEEIGDSLIEMMRHLLAAADWYALDRLKVICAQKLCDNLSVDTVADTLACAETYNCQQLRKKCIAFLADEKNLEAAMLSEGFVQLVQQCPSTVVTLKSTLQVMYPDVFHGDDDLDLGDSPTEVLERLLATTDRHALDRLKLMCAQILWDNVSVDTVATTLACAEMYTCPELKHQGIEFFAAKKNFKAVLTKGFVQLGQRFPSIIDELRERVGL